jgi:hypothetical protein
VRKLLLAGLSAFLVSPFAVLFGHSDAWCGQGEDFARFSKEASEGDADAQLSLGLMYYTGKGVAMNYGKALSWFHKAAERGDVDSQVMLGLMYYGGEGGATNYGQAMSWYRKAAEQGHADAQYSVGMMFDNGLGVTRDASEAVVWYRKAAEQGRVIAQSKLCAVQIDSFNAYSGPKPPPTPPGFHLDEPSTPGPIKQGEGYQWCLKAAEKGDALSQYNLGLNYENGLGVGRDDSEAVKWYQQAADQDFVPKGRDHKPGDLWDDARATRFERKKQHSPTVTASASKNKKSKEASESPAPAPKMVYSAVDKPGYTTPENSDNVAVVIGVEKYATLPSAEYAERDADAVRANLMALGYPARNIYFLSGQQATRAKIDQSLNTWLPKRINEKSTVFFYYSGHGAPDPKTNQAYLVPVDGDAEDLESTAYPIKQLYSKLGSLKARHVIVAFDSCFSGAGGRSVLAKGTRPLVSNIDLGGLPENVIALTASDKNQISGTIEAQRHGAFTYYLLKGLAGAAKNGAGAVTVQSLYDYLTPKVQDEARLHNRDQTPQLLSINKEKLGTKLR